MSRGTELVMYLVVKKSLGMSAGKVGAQCGHAVEMLLTEYFRDPRGDDTPTVRRIEAMSSWLCESRVKVVLGADDAAWDELVESVGAAGIRGVVVIDEGRTEIAPDSATVVGLWPFKRCDSPSVVAGLRPL